MQTLTLKADKSKMKQILELARSLKVDFWFSDETMVSKTELENKIKNYKSDIKAYKNGTLKTSSLGKGWKYL